jgi:phage terminase large subunit
MLNELQITYPRKFYPIARRKARRKIAKGGRGSGKSESFGRLAIREACTQKLRFLCCRELMSSIKDSVHKTLCDTISEFKLDPFFHITETSIKSWTGSDFIFKGMRNNYNEIKSLKGINRCWLEEGEGVSQHSLDILIPTIRAKDSEIWVSYNPEVENSPCNKTFITNAHPNSIIVEMNWRDNPWFPQVLKFCVRKWNSAKD